MKSYAFFILFLFAFIRSEEYFQQDVTYDIDVTLNDSNKTLSAFEKITYKNNCFLQISSPVGTNFFSKRTPDNFSISLTLRFSLE